MVDNSARWKHSRTTGLKSKTKISPSPPPLSPWQQEVRTRLKVDWLERGSTLHLPPNGFITAGPGPKAPAWDGGGGCWEEDVVMNTIILTQVDKIYTVSPSLILCGMFADLGG